MNWICVKNQLPEDEDIVLACGDDSVCWTAEYNDGVFSPDYGTPMKLEITHWMHLPEPPAEEHH